MAEGSIEPFYIDVLGLFGPLLAIIENNSPERAELTEGRAFGNDEVDSSILSRGTIESMA